MDAFAAIRNELVHEIDNKTARTPVSKDVMKSIAGKEQFEKRFNSFLKVNEARAGSYSGEDSITISNFLACVLLSERPEKHQILSKLERQIGKNPGDLQYFIPVAEEIAQEYNIKKDPLSGLYGGMRDSGSSFYDIKNGVARLEALIDSPVSARGSNSGLSMGSETAKINLNFTNPPQIQYQNKAYPLTGLHLEPETPRLYLEGQGKYFPENSLNINSDFEAKSSEILKNAVDLAKLRHQDEILDVGAYSLLFDGSELFIENIGINKHFPEYNHTGIEYLF